MGRKERKEGGRSRKLQKDDKRYPLASDITLSICLLEASMTFQKALCIKIINKTLMACHCDAPSEIAF